jgi:hypothetical protein
VIEPRSRGVLDPRLRGDDSNVWSYTIPVIVFNKREAFVHESAAKQFMPLQVVKWIASLLAMTWREKPRIMCYPARHPARQPEFCI